LGHHAIHNPLPSRDSSQNVAGFATQRLLRDRSAIAVESRQQAGGRQGIELQQQIAWPTSDWWQVYRKPQFDALIQQAIADSPT